MSSIGSDARARRTGPQGRSTSQSARPRWRLSRLPGLLGESALRRLPRDQGGSGLEVAPISRVGVGWTRCPLPLSREGVGRRVARRHLVAGRSDAEAERCPECDHDRDGSELAGPWSRQCPHIWRADVCHAFSLFPSGATCTDTRQRGRTAGSDTRQSCLMTTLPNCSPDSRKCIASGSSSKGNTLATGESALPIRIQLSARANWPCVPIDEPTSSS